MTFAVVRRTYHGFGMTMTDLTLDLLSPAKINLFLSVTGRRPDGYHVLSTLMVCIDIYDRIVLTFAGHDIRLTCDTPGIPEDESNLAFRAALLFQNAYRQHRGHSPFTGLAIQLHKTIPAGAGLGGGSGNAATVLKALNRQVKDPLSPEHLSALALKLGADVPFFMVGQPAVATGIGEQLAPWPGLRSYPLVVVFPGGGLATAEIYRSLNLRLTNCEKKLKGFPLKHGMFDAAVHLCNDLESVAMQRCPDIALIKKELNRLGALGALMSGSGSSVFGLFASADKARKARQRLVARAEWQVFQAKVLV
jgi:4-diphosphocytidyl-2-C-methyl-D-erythritol kinase